MREILFKGKSIQDDSWLYGSLIVKNDNYYISYISDVLGVWCMAQVHKNTIGQSTGMKDDSGEELYEGDLVEYKGFKFLIKYECGAFVLVRQDDIDMYELFEDCWNDDVYPLIQLYWSTDSFESWITDLYKVK